MPPKQPSGYQKRQKRKHDEEIKRELAGSMKKFVYIKPVEQQEHVEANVEANNEEHVEANVEQQEHVEGNVEANDEMHVEHNPNLVDIFDPRTWEGLNSNQIKLLVEKGPKRDTSIVDGPQNTRGRHFSVKFFTRTLSNMEKCDREWLVYSRELDKMFCFCCKLFKTGLMKGALPNDGYDDWLHASVALKEHEVSLDHLTNMTRWFDMRRRLKLNETIDKVQYEQFKKESDYWKEVLLRIMALVKYLGKECSAFRGKKDKLYQKGNGKFLAGIEMLAEFDPFIKEHVRRIMKDNLHVHYLGKNIQNEIIHLIGEEIRKEIIKKIKEAKYYSIILDCTPDTSHQEQMTIIVRYLTFSSNSVTIEESFLGYLQVNDTTGKGLFDVTIEELKSLGLQIDDIRGQGYDNGSNMKGKHQGVQKRFLDLNPRAFYTPCGCHSLNLTLCDMATACPKGKSFFGTIQRIYNIFANSTKRWQILEEHVKSWSLKPLSQTRWESHVESVKAIKLRLFDVRSALFEVGKKESDAGISNEAETLADTNLCKFEFLVSICIWYQVLYQVNIVSKRLQSEDMHLDIAIEEINNLIVYFKDYRETGFSKAIDEAKEIAIELGIDPIFPQKRFIQRKRHFDESSSRDEVSFTTEDDFRVNYFLYIIDKAIGSLETRFEQFKEYEKLFGFLFPHKLRRIEDKDLKLCCQGLGNALTFENKSDIDADELYMELKSFGRLQTNKFSNPVDVLQHLRALDCFPNASVAYRILLTIPVTVASAERSFSKLNLLKTYLRSTMGQERLCGLALMAIESEILVSIDYQELISQFAMKNARRSSRIIG